MFVTEWVFSGPEDSAGASSAGGHDFIKKYLLHSFYVEDIGVGALKTKRRSELQEEEQRRIGDVAGPTTAAISSCLHQSTLKRS